MRLKLIAAIIATVTAAPVLAQEGPPPPDPAPSFSGFRVEGLLGWDHAEILGDDQGGILYGVGVGYDLQAGRAVFGIEAEASQSTNNGCLSNIISAGDRFCVDTGRDLYIGGRAGLIVGRNVLLFGKAGYVNTRFRSDYDDGTPAGATNSSYATHLDGLRVGAGAQVGIGSHAYLRGEARYTRYDGGGDRGAVLGAFGFRF